MKTPRERRRGDPRLLHSLQTFRRFTRAPDLHNGRFYARDVNVVSDVKAVPGGLKCLGQKRKTLLTVKTENAFNVCRL